MIDPRAKQFLGAGPIEQIDGAVSKKAEEAHAAYQMKEFIERAGAFGDHLIAFFVEEKKRHQYRDDECAAAIALLTINLRHAYGSPQTPEEHKTWTDEKRDERLDEFDTICHEMQIYFDANYDVDDDAP